jgi:cell volume regulation protein A
MAEIVLVIGLLVFLAHFFTALFRRTRIPDVLLLLLLGVVLGPLTG